MGQEDELGELSGCCGPVEELDCGLGWAAGEVLGSGVAGGLGLGELLWWLGDDEFCWLG